MAKRIIHIGANKTGSTTLQRWLFSRHPKILYLGEDCERYEAHQEILDSIVYDDDLYFSSEAAQRLFNQFISSQGDKTFVYSNEDILRSRVPALCAQRLHKLVPDAEIVLIIRNQVSAVESWYINHGAYLKFVPRRYWRRFVSFDDWMNYCLMFLRYSPLDSFFYYRHVNLYASLFGKENVHVIFYEDFRNNRIKFFEQLGCILGINSTEIEQLIEQKRERRRHTLRQYMYHRFRSWFFGGQFYDYPLPVGEGVKKQWRGFLQAGPPAGGIVSDAWVARIRDLYKEDNALLAKEYNLPLKDYGYPLE